MAILFNERCPHCKKALDITVRINPKKSSIPEITIKKGVNFGSFTIERID